MMKRIFLIFIMTFLSGFFLQGTLVAEEASVQDQNLNIQLQQYLDEQIKLLKIPGAVLCISIPDNPCITLSSGVSDLSLGTKLKPSDRFRIASITKTFTAAAILLLMEDGRLSLNETVKQWLPGAVPNADKITIRHLLNHTSGIADYYKGKKGIKSQVFKFPLKIWTQKELVKVGLSMSPLFKPGGKWAYSNTAYILLGQIIEKASGMSYERFIHSRMLEPLGLNDTFVPKESDISGHHAHGYLDIDGDGKLEDVTKFHPSAVWSAGGMISTAKEMAIWAKFVYGGDIFKNKKDSMGNMFSFVNTEYGEVKYGLGVYKYREGIVGHDGDFMGYSTQIIYLTEDRISISVLTNSLPPNATNIAIGAFQILKGKKK